jgi:hypothetical protein
MLPLSPPSLNSLVDELIKRAEDKAFQSAQAIPRAKRSRVWKGNHGYHFSGLTGDLELDLGIERDALGRL